MTTITTVRDLAAHIADTMANHPAEEQAQIVEALRSADHPAWGTDWAEWLAMAAERTTESLVRGLRVWGGSDDMRAFGVETLTVRDGSGAEVATVSRDGSVAVARGVELSAQASEYLASFGRTHAARVA